MQQQPPRIRFRPVPVKARHDGWTPARQSRFIEVLAATRSIARACRAVGMSRESAYRLRDRPEAQDFALAWRRALIPEFVKEQQRGSLRRAKLKIHRQPTSSPLKPLSGSSDRALGDEAV